VLPLSIATDQSPSLGDSRASPEQAAEEKEERENILRIVLCGYTCRPVLEFGVRGSVGLFIGDVEGFLATDSVQEAFMGGEGGVCKNRANGP
jgi:hypothetical protein